MLVDVRKTILSLSHFIGQLSLLPQCHPGRIMTIEQQRCSRSAEHLALPFKSHAAFFSPIFGIILNLAGRPWKHSNCYMLQNFHGILWRIDVSTSRKPKHVVEVHIKRIQNVYIHVDVRKTILSLSYFHLLLGNYGSLLPRRRPGRIMSHNNYWTAAVQQEHWASSASIQISCSVFLPHFWDNPKAGSKTMKAL